MADLIGGFGDDGAHAPANTLGLYRVMFAVDDIEGTVARLRPLGATLVGEVTRYEGNYLLCYLRAERNYPRVVQATELRKQPAETPCGSLRARHSAQGA